MRTPSQAQAVSNLLAAFRIHPYVAVRLPNGKCIAINTKVALLRIRREGDPILSLIHPTSWKPLSLNQYISHKLPY